MIGFCVSNLVICEGAFGIFRTALHWAAKRGHVPVVKYLLDSGADRELKDSNAQLPADVTNSPDVISLLGGLHLQVFFVQIFFVV